MLLTLRSQVTLPYTLKHSYRWEILQIKVRDNKKSTPLMMQTHTVSETPITTFIVTWLISQKHFIVCSTHESLKEEGRTKTPANSCCPYWHSLWTTWRSYTYTTIKAQDINMISICWMLTSLNIRKWEWSYSIILHSSRKVSRMTLNYLSQH
jgi:hypothetical protein